MSETVTVGKPIPRVDALEKVTGQAIYGDDLRFSNLLYAKAVRSPLAHGKIVNIDLRKAERLKGVKAIVTGKDVPFLGGEALMDYPFLAIGKVRYIGEPVAAVAAVDEETASEAVELIEVEYEELPSVLDPVGAMEPGAPLVHEDLGAYKHIPVIKPVVGTNICHSILFAKGDVSKGFEESDIVFEDTFTTQMVQHGAIESHMAIAQVDMAGKITVWVTNDGPHRLRTDLANAMGLSLKKVRVIPPNYIGGNFGGKGGLKTETICIPLAMKANHRPVKMVLTREEVFTSTVVRHPSVVKLKTGVKKDGTLWAREAKVIYDTGAYAEKGPTVCQQACVAAVGPYKIRNVKVEGYCVYTNKVLSGAYRGYGIPQVAWAHESQMDIIANRLGIDPVEIRLKNVVEEGDTSPTGQQVLHSVGIKECIEKVAETLKWNTPRPKVANRGKGIACAYKNTKTPSSSSAIVILSLDGSMEVLTSATEIGQGSKTVLAQIAGEELGVSVENINMVSADTDITPFDASTTSSRTVFHVGNAVRMAGRDVKAQLFKISSKILAVDEEDLRVENGKIFSHKNPDKKLTFSQVIKHQYSAGSDIVGRGSYYPIMGGESGGMWSAPSIFWMYGAQCAEVEVDPETGRVRILRIVGAHDVGKAINPSTCKGQIEGGIVHGIGTALFEEMLIGEKGNVLNTSFLDYKLPTSHDVPEIVPILVEIPHREGPWGAKGIGEMTVVPVASAIANAIYDAVGVRIKDLPITPDKILKALKEMEREERKI
jgi:CO/xanthine dehydrogenase Mo-binding subunit